MRFEELFDAQLGQSARVAARPAGGCRRRKIAIKANWAQALKSSRRYSSPTLGIGYESNAWPIRYADAEGQIIARSFSVPVMDEDNWATRLPTIWGRANSNGGAMC